MEPFAMGAPDAGLLNWLFGSSAMASVPPTLPQLPNPSLVGDSFGPPTPMVPAQGLEMTDTTGGRAPTPLRTEDYRSQPMSLGAALEPSAAASGSGVPLPRPRPAEAPTAGAAGSDALLKSLRGVQMPAAPTPQKVSTPHLPPLRPIQGGGLAELMASLGVGPQQLMSGMKLPGTLGQALGGR